MSSSSASSASLAWGAHHSDAVLGMAATVCAAMTLSAVLFRLGSSTTGPASSPNLLAPLGTAAAAVVLAMFVVDPSPDSVATPSSAVARSILYTVLTAALIVLTAASLLAHALQAALVWLFTPPMTAALAANPQSTAAPAASAAASNASGGGGSSAGSSGRQHQLQSSSSLPFAWSVHAANRARLFLPPWHRAKLPSSIVRSAAAALLAGPYPAASAVLTGVVLVVWLAVAALPDGWDPSVSWRWLLPIQLVAALATLGLAGLARSCAAAVQPAGSPTALSLAWARAYRWAVSPGLGASAIVHVALALFGVQQWGSGWHTAPGFVMLALSLVTLAGTLPLYAVQAMWIAVARATRSLDASTGIVVAQSDASLFGGGTTGPSPNWSPNWSPNSTGGRRSNARRRGSSQRMVFSRRMVFQAVLDTVGSANAAFEVIEKCEASAARPAQSGSPAPRRPRTRTGSISGTPHRRSFRIEPEPNKTSSMRVRRKTMDQAVAANLSRMARSTESISRSGYGSTVILSDKEFAHQLRQKLVTISSEADGTALAGTSRSMEFRRHGSETRSRGKRHRRMSMMDPASPRRPKVPPATYDGMPVVRPRSSSRSPSLSPYRRPAPGSPPSIVGSTAPRLRSGLSKSSCLSSDSSTTATILSSSSSSSLGVVDHSEGHSSASSGIPPGPGGPNDTPAILPIPSPFSRQVSMGEIHDAGSNHPNAALGHNLGVGGRTNSLPIPAPFSYQGSTDDPALMAAASASGTLASPLPPPIDLDPVSIADGPPSPFSRQETQDFPAHGHTFHISPHSSDGSLNVPPARAASGTPRRAPAIMTIAPPDADSPMGLFSRGPSRPDSSSSYSQYSQQ